MNAKRKRFLTAFGRFATPEKFCFKDELPLYRVPRSFDPKVDTAFVWAQAQGAVSDLCCRVTDGDEMALKVLLKTLIQITGELEETMRAKPDFARPITRQFPRIPLLLGRNQGYRDRADETLRVLEVGENVPLKVVQRDSGGRPSGANPLVNRNDVALCLLEYVEVFRDSARFYNARGESFGVSVETDGDLPPWGNDAIALPAFSAASASQWGDVAIAVLVDAFGTDLSKVPRLRVIGESAGQKDRQSMRGKAARVRANEKLDRRWAEGTAMDRAIVDTLRGMPKRSNPIERGNINSKIRAEIKGAIQRLAKR